MSEKNETTKTTTPNQPTRLGPFGHEIELDNVWLPRVFSQHSGSTGFTVGQNLVGTFLYRGIVEKIVLCLPSGVVKVTVTQADKTRKSFLVWGEGFQAGCPL